jgi:small subunit ribosomal protein S1
VAEAQTKAAVAATTERDDRGGGGGSSSSSSRSDAPAQGTLASDEALAALRDKLSGGQS